MNNAIGPCAAACVCLELTSRPHLRCNQVRSSRDQHAACCLGLAPDTVPPWSLSLGLGTATVPHGRCVSVVPLPQCPHDRCVSSRATATVPNGRCVSVVPRLCLVVLGSRLCLVVLGSRLCSAVLYPCALRIKKSSPKYLSTDWLQMHISTQS